MVACRRYRESVGEYWTVEQPARLHWEALYAEVSLERQLGVSRERPGPKRRERCDLDVRFVRATLCTQLGIPEESMLTERLSDFYKDREQFARLPLQYPDARVVKNPMASDVVGAFRKTFGEVSDGMHTATDALKATNGRLYDRAKRVAEQEHLVVWPMQTAEACCVAAYAILQRKQLFEQQCWIGSRLLPIQRTFGDKYPVKDFHFWAMYGNWSCCQHRGSYHFDDAYFREDVYKDPGTSLSHVRQVPSDPLEHCHGSVGISSRWRYRPGMYKPLA